jgi:hypothetical protein
MTMIDNNYFNAFIRSSGIHDLFHNRLANLTEVNVRISLYACFMAGVQYANEKVEAPK